MHWPSRRVALCEQDMMSDWMVESETANRGSRGEEKKKREDVGSGRIVPLGV